MGNLKRFKIQLIKNKKGFTLSELIIAISLTLIIISSAYVIYTISQKSFKTGSQKDELTQNAKIGLEKISRELRETSKITITLPPTGDDPENPPANEITFRDANYSNIRYINYYLSDNNLNRRIYHYYIEGNPDNWVAYNTTGATSQLDGETTIASYIAQLEFYGQSIVTINIRAQLDSDIVNLTTQVSPRNI